MIACIECNAYKGHSPTCSLISFEQAKEELKFYVNKYVENNQLLEFRKANLDRIMSKRINNLKKENEYWKGKYLVVKHENNQLRKKLK